MAKLTDLQQAFIDEYFLCDLNGTEAAGRAGYQGNRNTLASIASENLRKPKIRAEIDRRLKERTMQANEVLYRLAEQARADLGAFFKLVEEWTFYPLPTHDILDAEEVIEKTDDGEERVRISYLVRRVALDTEKLVDPRYSHLLHKVSDSKRGGLRIEIFDKQAALIQLGKYHSLFIDRVKVEDWRSEAIDLIRRNEITFDALAEEFDRDLAVELFKAAGVPVQAAEGSSGAG